MVGRYHDRQRLDYSRAMIGFGTLVRWIGQFWVALRVLSLTLAVGATTSGILAAAMAGHLTSLEPLEMWILIALVTVAGVASQAGANLINDYFEGSFKYQDPGAGRVRFLGRDRTAFDVVVFLGGLGALGLAGLIGLYLVWRTDWVMLAIGVIGLVGSYAYTGEPFVYKRRGLGVVLSFVLMGPLMSLGAWYPFAQELSWYPIIIGLPISLLVPAMMLSNEMRDFRRDTRIALGTLATRIGERKSLALYDTLVGGAFLLVGLYVALDLYPVWTLSALVMIPAAIAARRRVAGLAPGSIPWTNAVHLGLVVTICGALLAAL